MVFSNATLHWVIDHRPVLRGISRALKPGGRLLLQMGGRGNAADILSLMDALPADSRWGRYFPEQVTAYGFYGPEEYVAWLREAGLTPVRVELLERDMAQAGKEGLASWVRTTWLPYTQRVPEERRDDFVSDIVDRYVRSHPPDSEGLVHVRMFRLEVEATKPGANEGARQPAAASPSAARRHEDALRQLAVQHQQPRPVAADELQVPQDAVRRLLFLHLLVHKPLQEACPSRGPTRRRRRSPGR